MKKFLFFFLASASLASAATTLHVFTPSSVGLFGLDPNAPYSRGYIFNTSAITAETVDRFEFSLGRTSESLITFGYDFGSFSALQGVVGDNVTLSVGGIILTPPQVVVSFGPTVNLGVYSGELFNGAAELRVWTVNNVPEPSLALAPLAAITLLLKRRRT